MRVPRRSLVLALVAPALIAGTSPPALRAALGPSYGGVLRVAVPTLPASTAPQATPTVAVLASTLVHETLVGWGPDGVPTPSLARSWKSGASGREWTLTLDGRARFHGGRPVTAEDASASLRRFLRAPSAAAAALARRLEGGTAFRAGTSDDLPGLAARGDSLVLRFPGGASGTTSALAALASPLAAVTTADGTGCGPFAPILDLPGRRLAFSAFAAHVRGRPLLDRVELRLASDADERRDLLRSGRVEAVVADAGVSSLASVLLLVVHRTPPFELPRTRAALAGAFDRTALVEPSLPGALAVDALLPPVLLVPLDPHPVPRREGLAASPLVLAVSRDVPPAVSQRLAALLASFGMRPDVQPIDPGSADPPGIAVRLRLWTPEVAEPGLALRELLALAGPSGTVAREVERELDAADGEPDSDRRRVHLYRAESALRSESLLVPLAVVPVSIATAPGVHGVRVDFGGRIRLEDAWKEP